MAINMSLSEAALRKLTKDEAIALALEYQAKFAKCYSENTKNFGLINKSMLFECLMAYWD